MTVTPRDFWDRIAPGYSQRPIADTASYARKLASTQALMRPDMQVLEFGCGTGSTALEHAPHVAHIVATDVAPAMLAIGRDKAAQAGIDNISFQEAAVEDFTAPDGSFDMVLALNLLHLLPDRAGALSKIHGLLKPGGLFISSTVCLADRLWYLRPVIPVLQWLGKAPYVSFVSAKKVRREVEAAGFAVQEHWSHGRANSLFMVATRVELA
ncbi:MAG: class I SAM-dependent methyltransferase [Gammaproteobacteria bacterium]|jgi:ubiquinone/menaquinone biosynthesis C-methylase UbiE|nr:class I SAM-dependent methyltransferase [Gammaproteobacteria bacterium]